MSFIFSCPVCGCALKKDGRSFKCENGHCFDIAKQGYVNLLQSQQSSSKRHGDDRLMAQARTDFLNKGYYDPLADFICKKTGERAFDGMKLADLGCGECFYTSVLARKFPQISVGGIDISKYSLIAGSKREGDFFLAVASVFKLPISKGYCDAVTTVFSPHGTEEIHRILKKGGFWLRAYPLEKHLMGLKSLVYERPYLNEVDRGVPEGFSLLSRDEIKYNITLEDNIDIMNLFSMTPYFYKTGRLDQEKLEKCDFLETEVEFGIDIFLCV